MQYNLLKILVAALGCLAAACSEPVQLNVLIYDPCDQEAISEADHIQLEVWAPVEGDYSEVIWSAAAGAGELPEVGLTEAAWVSVTGRESDKDGNPAAAVIAGTVGEVDLSGTDGKLVEINVVVGRVGQFMDTTDVADTLQCSGLGGPRHDHAAARLRDGRVLLAGGYRPTADGALEWWTFLEMYEPTKGSYTKGPSLRGARRGMTATLLDMGKVLLAGGEHPKEDEDKIETSKASQLFDPATDSLEDPVAMLEARAYHTATPLGDGRVLIAGGSTRVGGDRSFVGSTEIYDPSSGVFTPGPTLLQPRANHAAVRVGKATVALIGGSGPGGPLNHVEFVDLDSNLVTDGEPLRVARSHLSAALVPGSPGYIAVLGGFSNAAADPTQGNGLALVELIWVETSTGVTKGRLGSCTTTLNQARGAAMLAPLDDGLLIAGGVSESGQILASAEIFRVENIFACELTSVNTLGALGTARAGATVTPLLGGDLLFSGGFGHDKNGQVVAVDRGEIYVRYR